MFWLRTFYCLANKLLDFIHLIWFDLIVISFLFSSFLRNCANKFKYWYFILTLVFWSCLKKISLWLHGTYLTEIVLKSYLSSLRCFWIFSQIPQKLSQSTNTRCSKIFSYFSFLAFLPKIIFCNYVYVKWKAIWLVFLEIINWLWRDNAEKIILISTFLSTQFNFVVFYLDSSSPSTSLTHNSISG